MVEMGGIEKSNGNKTKKLQPKKLKVGFYGITGCAGCQLSVLFSEDDVLGLFDLVDVRAFPFLRAKNIEEEFDVVFMEGLVACEADLAVLKKLREKTKTLVALGACAHTGCVPAYRAFTLKENFVHLLFAKKPGIRELEPAPLDAHVKVDYVIPGCPPDKREILAFIQDIAAGREPKSFNNPVCVECRRNNNKCLLEDNKPCLGPITLGGCNAICINGGFECWGCRGQTDDLNIKEMISLLKSKGFSEQLLSARMRKCVGLKI